MARTCGIGAPPASHMSRSTSARDVARRISRSYGFEMAAVNVALRSESITSSRPGSDGSIACCATMRAARSGCSVNPIVTSAAIDAGLIGSNASPV